MLFTFYGCDTTISRFNEDFGVTFTVWYDTSLDRKTKKLMFVCDTLGSL